MASMSNWLENAVLDQVLRGVAYPGSSTIYAALFLTPTTDSGGGVEVSGGGYARVQVTTFGAPSSGVISNTSNVQFPAATANWGLVTHFALYDASTGGNLLYHGPLTASKTVNAGDTFVLPPGNITVAQD